MRALYLALFYLLLAMALAASAQEMETYDSGFRLRDGSLIHLDISEGGECISCQHNYVDH